MQVISFLNMKGGVGKTTLAVNIAYGLAWLHKKNVLVVDADRAVQRDSVSFRCG
jgi:chromosome partitioning protein